MLTTKYPHLIRCKKCLTYMDAEGNVRRNTPGIRVIENGVETHIPDRVDEFCDHEAQTLEQSCAERYKPRPENLEGLSKDLDGDYYVVNETFPEGWKVTPCCGSFIKGVENGIVCRSCFEPMDNFPDGPARLKESDPRVRPARETAVRIDLSRLS